MHTSLSTLNDGSLRAVETDPLGHLVTCLDNHPGAETAVAHQLLLTNGANGSAFATVDFDASGRRLTSPAVEMRERSLVCPRWTSDRATSVTSTPVIDDDFSTVAMHITDASASHTIAVDGCNLHATSVSPNDTFIAVNVTCYGERWADSGLYLLAMSKVTETNNLSDMQLVASGVFGRSAFHPDGTALAATRTEAIANQTAATDFNAADSSLAIFDLVTGDEQNLTLPHDAKAHSVAWLSQPAH